MSFSPAYRTALGRPKAEPGRQRERIAGAEIWVVPNPSGLNAHETTATLAVAYGEAAPAAGIARASAPATPAGPAAAHLPGVL